jgi:hypothetical protein
MERQLLRHGITDNQVLNRPFIFKDNTAILLRIASKFCLASKFRRGKAKLRKVVPKSACFASRSQLFLRHDARFLAEWSAELFLAVAFYHGATVSLRWQSLSTGQKY